MASSERTRERRHQYAVAWRAGDGPIASGRLELAAEGLLLNGLCREEVRIPFEDVASVEIGRAPGERINGDKSVVLERHSCERVLIAAIGGVGLLGELNDLLARLRAERTAQARVAVVVPIRRGRAEEARRLVAEGPPFAPERLPLERHHVFISEREVVFVFEGESVAAAVDALSRDPAVLNAALRWRGVLGGRPRLAAEGFGWARAEPPDET